MLEKIGDNKEISSEIRSSYESYRMQSLQSFQVLNSIIVYMQCV